MTLRGLQAPILAGILQEHAPPGDRATVLSLAAPAFRLAFVVAAPAVGALIDHAGLSTGLAILAGASAAGSALALAAFRRAGPMG